MCKILMPINTEYVDEILSGNKKYEYRKIKAKRKNIDKMVIYSTSPIMRVVAEVDVEGIIEDSPEKLWEKTKEYSGIYNLNKINSLDKYDVYLSGATPMLTIENPDYNGTKELIVFRDSYGSSLIPLLVTGYSKVTVVDTRYISPKVLNQYIEFKDQDVLFMYSTLIINNSTTLK